MVYILIFQLRIGRRKHGVSNIWLLLVFQPIIGEYTLSRLNKLHFRVLYTIHDVAFRCLVYAMK